jgi:hypothetical protein
MADIPDECSIDSENCPGEYTSGKLAITRN